MTDLDFKEGPGLDGARLSRLYRDLGERAADHLICEAMEDLALGLARAGRAHCAADHAALSGHAARIEDVAGHIGLAKLGRVAGDVRACAAGPVDPAALSATMARLARVGDVSLSAIWDPKNLTV